jgi:filamin
VDNGDGSFKIYFSVEDAGEYTLSLRFGGQPIPDGVYNFSLPGEEGLSELLNTPQPSSAISGDSGACSGIRR